MNEFVSRICRLDNIRQWEERDSVISESVSQHSFKVAVLTLMLTKEIKRNSLNSGNGRNIELEDMCNKAVEYSLMHDFDEAILCRDISHVIKYNKFNGEDIRTALNSFVEHELEIKFPLAHEVLYKDVTPEVKLICKVVDWFCLLTFIERNKRAGSFDFEEEYDYCIDNLKEKIDELTQTLLEKHNVCVNIKALFFDR